MPVNLSEHRGTVGTSNNGYLIRFRNSYQHFKYYLNDINFAFGVISFSCSILATISIFFLSLSVEFFVCITVKNIFLFSRFEKIKEALVSISVFTFFVSFFPRNHFIICHWNLNSISVHNCAKVQLLKAYLAVHKFDTVCRSETYLNSTFSFDDDSLDISSYIMVTADHPANSKRGSVCMYFL